MYFFLSIYSQTSYKLPVNGQSKMALKRRWLFNIYQDTIKWNIWNHKKDV